MTFEEPEPVPEPEPEALEEDDPVPPLPSSSGGKSSVGVDVDCPMRSDVPVHETNLINFDLLCFAFFHFRLRDITLCTRSLLKSKPRPSCLSLW